MNQLVRDISTSQSAELAREIDPRGYAMSREFRAKRRTASAIPLSGRRLPPTMDSIFASRVPTISPTYSSSIFPGIRDLSTFVMQFTRREQMPRPATSVSIKFCAASPATTSTTIQCGFTSTLTFRAALIPIIMPSRGSRNLVIVTAPTDPAVLSSKIFSTKCLSTIASRNGF